VVFAIQGHDPIQGIYAFFLEPVTSLWGIEQLIIKATPLIIIALGLAVCYLSNNWNIGAEGQLTIGAITGSLLPTLLPDFQNFATLPLMHQPGEKWLYDVGLDVMGVLIARAARQPFETFLRARLFEPLGMKDTGFSVPATEIDRLATCYSSSPASGALEVYDEAKGGHWSRPPAFPAAASGLVSTVDDYLAFGQMLLNKGRHGRERILSRPSVETMTTDQLTIAQKTASGLVGGYFDSHGWGFGLSMVTRRRDVAGSVGQFGWDGGLGTSWRSDPQEDMVGIVMTQRAWSSPRPPEVCLDFWTGAYQAIDD